MIFVPTVRLIGEVRLIRKKICDNNTIVMVYLMNIVTYNTMKQHQVYIRTRRYLHYIF